MKFVDEFRDPELAEHLLQRIKVLLNTAPLANRESVRVMEVCGGHTHTIFKYGLDRLLPSRLELIHGPGCPVCVLPRDAINTAIEIALQPKVILASFGDALRVPGTRMSLLQARAAGADVRTVYSPMDALALAKQHPDHSVVFFAIGFETTIPATALTLLQAERENVENFTMLARHISIIPTLKALLDDPELEIHGFIGPGHVSMVIGTEPYEFVAQAYGKPLVVSGFEPLDLLQSLQMVLEQLASGTSVIENQYARVVRKQGNAQAQQAISTLFEPRASDYWQGLGKVAGSGLQFRPEYSHFDAEQHFLCEASKPSDTVEQGCCDQVLKGALQPQACPLFGGACTPSQPVGALMVSSEGACAARYLYRSGEHRDVG